MSARRQLPWRNPIPRSLAAALAVVGVGGLLIWGFFEGRGEIEREAERESPVKAPLRVSIKNGVPLITLDRQTQQNSGIETTAIPSGPYQQQVRAFAMVLDPARLTDLSNSYANAKAQAQMAQAKVASSKAALVRAQSLIKSQLETSASLAQAEATLLADQAAVTAAESQVRTLSATAYQEWGPVLGKSLVEGSETITRLIERQYFLLQITLPPGVSVPKPPDTAAIQVAPDRRAEITFVSAATRTDPKIQGISFFYLAPVENDLLPGMNVLAFLPSGKRVEGVTVPASAIVWWQDKAWVYRRVDPNAFARSDIATDLPAAGGGYIVAGLPNGVEVVTRGAQLLLSEEFRAQIQVGED